MASMFSTQGNKTTNAWESDMTRFTKSGNLRKRLESNPGAAGAIVRRLLLASKGHITTAAIAKAVRAEGYGVTSRTIAATRKALGLPNTQFKFQKMSDIEFQKMSDIETETETKDAINTITVTLNLPPVESLPLEYLMDCSTEFVRRVGSSGFRTNMKG